MALWVDFSKAFLDYFFPQGLRDVKTKEFVNLKQGRMFVQEYALKFNQLLRYAPEMVFSMRDRMCKFILGFSCELVLERKEALLIDNMDFLGLLCVCNK